MRDWASDVPSAQRFGKATVDFTEDVRIVGLERGTKYHLPSFGLPIWSGPLDVVRIKKAAPVLTSVMTWCGADGEMLERGELASAAGWLSPRERGADWFVDDRGFYPLLVGEKDELATLFDELAEQWDEDTWAYSFIERKVLHPAYQRIIGMGRDAVPLILGRLKECGPDHWFWALEMITGENPAEGTDTMEDAADAWLAWGHGIGYI